MPAAFAAAVPIWRPEDESDFIEPSHDPVWRARGAALCSVLAVHPEGLSMRELRQQLLVPGRKYARIPFSGRCTRVRWLLVEEALAWLGTEGLVAHAADGRYYLTEDG